MSDYQPKDQQYPQPEQPVYQPPQYSQPQQPVYQSPQYPQPEQVYQPPQYPQPQQPVYQPPQYPQPEQTVYQTPQYPQYQQYIYQPVYPAPKKKLGAGAITAIVLGAAAFIMVFVVAFVGIFGLLSYNDYMSDTEPGPDAIVVDSDNYYEITDYYFNRLNPEQKQVYYCLTLGAGDYSFETPLDLNDNEFLEAYFVFRFHNMTFPGMNIQLAQVYERDRFVIGISVYESYNTQMVAEFNEAASILLSRLPSAYADDYEKAKAIADLICEIAEYDYYVIDNPPPDSFSPYDDPYLRYPAWSDYGVIVEGRAVCDGYSKAFQYLSDQLGLTCLIVYGDGFDGDEFGPHAWNIVLIDGDWYHLDVTWMDVEDYVNYDYFLISDRTLSIDHRDYHWCDINYLEVSGYALPLAPYDYQIQHDAA